jgi:hypothetical protein
MKSHLIAALIGATLVIVFLMYYVLHIKSIPLTFIMVAIIVMVCVNLYEEVKQQHNNNKKY